MAGDLEDVYVALRGKILRGELPSGEPLTTKRVADEYDLSEKKSLPVLKALSADGYLYREHNTFTVAVWSHDQIEEWRQTLGAFCEIGAGRLVLDGGHRLAELRRHVDQTLAQWDVEEERFYLAALTFCGMLLGGSSSDLARLAGQLIPPVFFRLLWVADKQTERGTSLRRMIARFFEIAPSRSVREAKAACVLYFDGIAPALHAQLDARNQSAGVGIPIAKSNQFIEPRLTGHSNIIARGASPSGPQLLLPELRHALPARLTLAG